MIDRPVSWRCRCAVRRFPETRTRQDVSTAGRQDDSVLRTRLRAKKRKPTQVPTNRFPCDFSCFFFSFSLFLFFLFFFPYFAHQLSPQSSDAIQLERLHSRHSRSPHRNPALGKGRGDRRQERADRNGRPKIRDETRDEQDREDILCPRQRGEVTRPRRKSKDSKKRAKE